MEISPLLLSIYYLSIVIYFILFMLFVVGNTDRWHGPLQQTLTEENDYKYIS